MNSIRAQLLRRIILGASLVLAGGSVVLALAIHNRLLLEFDRRLLTKAKALAVLTSLEGRRIEFEPAGPEDPDLRMQEEGDLYRLDLHDGTVFAHSDAPAVFGLPVAVSEVLDVPSYRTIRLADGVRRRMVSFSFRPRIEPENPQETWPVEIPPSIEPGDVRVVVTVAGPVGPVRLLIFTLCLVLAGVDLVVLACIVWLAWKAVGDGLGPLDQLNGQIAALDGDDAGRIVELADPPEELQPVVDALNGLLERQRLALDRERQFASDASHELRTPVAELRALCEVGGRWPEDAGMVRGFFEDVGVIARQMQQTVTNLLVLSRCSAGTLAIEPEEIPLLGAVTEAWRKVEARAEGRRMAFQADVDPGARVHCDRGMLDMILQNLLDNAVSHGDAGGTIRCQASDGAEGAVLEVSNPASSLSAEDLPHVFDRFWRKSAARGDREHTGLGLAISKGLCTHLGVDVRMDMPSDGTVRVRLFFPAGAAGPHQVSGVLFPRPIGGVLSND